MKIKSNSSHIDTLDYDHKQRVLKIQFKNGDTWHYQGVGQQDYDALTGAKSHGEHFHANIKNQFIGKKV